VCLAPPGGLSAVKDTLAWLAHESEVWFEITTLLIPGLNDGDQEVRELARWVATDLGADVPLHFTAFHPAFRLLDRPRTPAPTLTRARSLALDCGLHFVYTGNVYDPEGQTTHCPSCGRAVIERDGYTLLSYALDERGTCPCGTLLPGVFAGLPGHPHERRLPVRVS
jgi:pyruvate formate lyase activating enzyme